MQIAFLNPLWLLGVLALVPLLAHLFSRTRPKRRSFPSVLLLREALRHVTRVRRPRDRWLLILRTLAMLAVVLALLQPWLFSRFGGAGRVKTVVVVVDVTASMGYVEGTRTRLAKAAAAAEDVLAALPTNSRANIVWAKAHPAGVLPEPAPNLEVLRQALRTATVHPEAGSPGEALGVALRQLEQGAGERELVVISDFQKTAWAPVRWDIPGGIRLTRIGVGEGEGANVGLADLATEPEQPVAGQEARVVCRVRNFSGEPRRSTVFVQAGESRLSQAVEMNPWSETLAVLPIKFPEAGSVALKATLTGDSFPADDVRYRVAEVRGALEVAVAASASDVTGQAWLRALQALDHVHARRVEPADLGAAGRPDLLFVAHWAGEGRPLLRELRERGTALVVQPAHAAVPPLASEPANVPVPPPQQRDAPGWGVRIANDTHPLFALYARGSFGEPVDRPFRRRINLTAPEQSTALLAFDDGVPALALALDENGTPLVWWNLDLEATEWTQRPGFVMFLGEILQHLTRRRSRGMLAGAEPGEPLRFEAGAARDLKDVTLLGDDEKAVTLQRSAAQLASAESPGPGSYRWMGEGAVLSRVAVNFPETESDLRRLVPSEMSGASGALLEGADRERLSGLREGRMLWPWCLAAAAACLLAEAALLLRFARKEVA